MKVNGVITALVTPFDEIGKVNVTLLEDLCKYQLKAGVNGIFLLGTTGEGIFQSIDERKYVAEVVLHELKGKIPVVIHVGSSNINDVFTLAKHAVDIGADAIASITPFFYKYSEKEIYNYYLELSKNVPDDFAIYIYNLPNASGNDIKPGTVEKIIEKAKNIVGIKYSSDNLIQTQEYIKLKLKKKEFNVLSGSDQLFYPLLCMGCDGLVSGNANILPELFVNIYKYFKNSNHEKAKKLNEYGGEIAKLFNYGYIPSIKSGMRFLGINGGNVKLPFKELSQEEEESLRKEFNLIYNNYKRVIMQIED